MRRPAAKPTGLDRDEPWFSATFHLQREHGKAIAIRSKCGRSKSKTFKVIMNRYIHMMSLGRRRLEQKGITDLVIQGIAEALFATSLESLDVVQCIPSLTVEHVEPSVHAALLTLDDLELLALADAVEMMFSRYQAE